ELAEMGKAAAQSNVCDGSAPFRTILEHRASQGQAMIFDIAHGCRPPEPPESGMKGTGTDPGHFHEVVKADRFISVSVHILFHSPDVKGCDTRCRAIEQFGVVVGNSN